MKEGTITKSIILSICLAFTITIYGQNPVYSTIAKNINPEAKSLRHDLNKAGDTLVLESDFILYKIEFIGNYDLKVFEIEGSKKQAKLDLSTVPVGEYTIAAYQIESNDEVYQYQKTIIFRVSRLLPINRLEGNLKDAIAIADEGSLEEETQKKNTVNINEDIAFEDSKAVALEEAKPAVVDTKKRKPNKLRLKKKKRVAIAHNQKTKTIKPKYKTAERTKHVLNDESEKRSLGDKSYTSSEVVDEDGVVYKPYNLTNSRGGRVVVQSRAEYRANNLRPNGEPYN